MSKRYYYTDPLAANWMMKHFGMKMQRWTQDGKDILETLEWPNRWSTYWQGKMYIHTDSLHLLEPQDGDYTLLFSHYHDKCGFHVVKNKLSFGYDLLEIFKRNAIPFMWPESEEAV